MIPAVIIMNRLILMYESQSLLSAVEAASSIITGDSMIKARGKTIPPYAARLISGSASLATIALRTGSSAPIKSQLAANGHQVLNTIPLSNVEFWESFEFIVYQSKYSTGMGEV